MTVLPSWALSSDPRAQRASGTWSTWCLSSPGPRALLCRCICTHGDDTSQREKTVSDDTELLASYLSVWFWSDQLQNRDKCRSYEFSLAWVTSLELKWLIAKKSYVPLTSCLSSSLKTGRLWEHREDTAFIKKREKTGIWKKYKLVLALLYFWFTFNNAVTVASSRTEAYWLIYLVIQI